MYKREAFETLLNRIKAKRKFIQVISGPRQVGKSTLARQITRNAEIPFHFSSADEPTLKDKSWIEQQWEVARHLLKENKHVGKSLLILDELQKIPNWSETVKKLWDKDSVDESQIHVIILGSSPFLMQKGLTESLTGRFEVIHLTHWSFAEMKQAFHWNLNQFVFYGGYPGSADLIGEPKRWKDYVSDSLIETTLSRDILLMTRVDKPALMRRLFDLGCHYSSQILSFQKMLGQLQDAGNTTTLAHYLELLGKAGLLTGIQKYAGQKVRQRGSSPKLLALNTAIITAQNYMTLEEARKNTEFWGHLVESSVGAFLANNIKGENIELFYWASGNKEVDFVLVRGKEIVGIEVKSNRKRASLSGIEAFSKEFPVKRKLLAGADGIPLEEFLVTPPEEWFK